MPSQIPDIRQLQAFLAVASELSFTGAGAKLNQTQSAISHQIRKLESQLGTALFNRNTNQVEITEAGAALHLKLRPIIKQLDVLFDTRVAPNDRTVLEIELETGFATFWLTPRLADFTERFPEIDITINVSHRRLEFVGNTELAIKWGDEDWRGFSSERLMELRLTPMCAPALARKLKKPEDILGQVLLHEKDYALWSQWSSVAGLAGTSVESGHVFQDTAMLHHAAVRGHGVALFAVELAAEATAKMELVAPFSDMVLSTTHAYYLVTRTRRLTAAGKSFAQWVKGQVAMDMALNYAG
ncbi:DNA-binding transcriptional LysR family regulator [Mycoplana sp. BE70]|uniref:LysR substrate-binding domain-containing protein n=1 Tax=Mycoplana sp. BE70 TaxID=2817775 RepID=UPI00285DECEC|nr:LysR substrate-binding domain-containing protein [Mycoplana sp. BE70]MDR6759133.1 DNA-binding transcriptional LysR family regulator [Mycoplana sp. BE70]